MVYSLRRKIGLIETACLSARGIGDDNGVQQACWGIVFVVNGDCWAATLGSPTQYEKPVKCRNYGKYLTSQNLDHLTFKSCLHLW